MPQRTMQSTTSHKQQMLEERALFYLNYSEKQKQAVRDYLLGKAKMPDYRPEFDKHAISVLANDDASGVYFVNTLDNVVDLETSSKLKEVKLIKAYRHMYETGQIVPFQKAVRMLYGAPKEELYLQLLKQAISQAEATRRDKKILQELYKLINFDKNFKFSSNFINIDPELFHFAQYSFNSFYAIELKILKRAVSDKPIVHRYSHKEIIGLLDILLKHYELDKEGWRACLSDRVEKIAVNYKAKQINVAPGSIRLSRHRAVGLVLHEVAVHALSRRNIIRYGRTIAPRRILEEGLGVLVEQLVFSKYQPVRSLRYIALGLAIGLDNKPRDAKEVYEVIWRLRYLSGIAGNKKLAQEYAAKEVARIFRGMPLNQKGIVITKDRAYVEGNQIAWAAIQKKGPETIFGKLLVTKS
jgi:hypothetical protein